MPVYLDHHGAVQLPPAVAQQMAADVKARKKNPQFGTTPLNIIMGKTDTWCLSEAPTADVVHKMHEAMGIKLDKGQVYEVQTLA